MFGLFESKEQKKQRLLVKGMQALTSGKFNEAESCFLKAIEFDIFNAAEAWIGLGSLYLVTESYKKAKDCFSTAVDQARNDFHAIRGMALVERKLGNHENSLMFFRQLKNKFDYKPGEDPMLTISDVNWLSENGL